MRKILWGDRCVLGHSFYPSDECKYDLHRRTQPLNTHTQLQQYKNGSSWQVRLKRTSPTQMSSKRYLCLYCPVIQLLKTWPKFFFWSLSSGLFLEYRTWARAWSSPRQHNTYSGPPSLYFLINDVFWRTGWHHVPWSCRSSCGHLGVSPRTRLDHRFCCHKSREVYRDPKGSCLVRPSRAARSRCFLRALASWGVALWLAFSPLRREMLLSAKLTQT